LRNWQNCKRRKKRRIGKCCVSNFFCYLGPHLDRNSQYPYLCEIWWKDMTQKVQRVCQCEKWKLLLQFVIFSLTWLIRVVLELLDN
jgi:hypothetical protein